MTGVRLLFVSDFYVPSGGAITPLCAELASRGHHVWLLAGSDESAAAGGAAETGSMELRLVPYRWGGGPGEVLRFVLRMARAARRLAEDVGFGVLCFNHPLSALGVLLGSSFPGSVRTYCVHSPWPEEWAVENRRGRRPHPRPEFLAYPLRWLTYQANVLPRRALEDCLLRRCHAYMVLSRFMRRRLLHHHPRIAPQRVRVIPGATDTRRFSPEGGKAAARRRLGLPLRRPILLVVRRLVARMGLDALLEAMPEVLRAAPRVLLLLGGAGPLRAQLEQRARELSLGEAVRFLGYVSPEDLPVYYRAADLFVLPTRSLEGFGLVTIEALASGTPVVGTPVGGTVEILTALEPGLLAADTSPAALAERVTWWLTHRAELRALSGRCRRFALEHYSLRTMADRVERWFEEVSSGRPPAGGEHTNREV